MLPLLIITLGVSGVLTVRRRLERWQGALVAATTVAGFAAVTLYSQYIVSRVWNDPVEANSYVGVAKQLTKSGSTGVSAAGQTWYLLVTWAGLAGIGFIHLVRLSRRAEPQARGDRDVFRIVLVTVLALGALSVLFMSDRPRADRIVYGRYNDAMIGPIVLIGLGSLLTRRTAAAAVRRLGVIAVAIVALGMTLYVTSRHDLGSEGGVRAMVLGLQSFLGRSTAMSLSVMSITVAAALITLLVAGAAWLSLRVGSQVPLIAVLVILVLVSVRRTDDVMSRTTDAWARPTIERLDESVLTQDAPIDYLLEEGSSDTVSMMIYQFYLPHHEFRVVSDPLEPSPTRFVFAPDDNDELSDAGAELVWRDPLSTNGLWVRPAAAPS